MIKAKVRLYEIETGKPIIIMNSADMKELGIHLSDRVTLSTNGNKAAAIVDATTGVVKEGEVGVFQDLRQSLGVKEGEKIDIKAAGRPVSIDYIKKKLKGEELHGHQIRSIIQDIVDNNLSDIELAAFVSSAFINGYTMDETVALTNAMVESGQQIDFGDNVVDKHCIGGVAGNRTTMIVTPIIAAAGLTIPKTSSRAITSPAGTADTMEVLCPVEINITQLKEIVKKVGGCIIWGGSVNLAPADDKIIRIEYPLSLDPEGQVLASVMAKKKSVGSDYVVIDIPVGVGAKIEDMTEAQALAGKFIELGRRLNIKVEAIITDGSAPVGNGIGPALEARDVLEVLDGRGPIDLVSKSLDMAGVLLELAGKSRKGEGRALAESILSSGKAKRKMMEIIEAQGGNPNITAADIKVGDKTHDILASTKGRIKSIDNKRIAKVARTAGAPKDQAAGVYLHAGVGDTVDTGQKLFTIYAVNESKLTEAAQLAEQIQPVSIGGAILKKLN
ncbi:AMP phosphorylase [uncultured archaeon]|nr:AMP phosphorylase [uncultured archaeon]